MTAQRRVRVAGTDDAEMVGSMLFDFNIEFDTETPDAGQFARRFRDLLGRPDVLVLCAGGSDAQATGFAFLTLRPTPYYDGPLAQVEELYVRPAVRGRGIGTTLLTTAIERLRERGAGEMHINVDEVDTDAPLRAERAFPVAGALSARPCVHARHEHLAFSYSQVGYASSALAPVTAVTAWHDIDD